MKKTTKRKLHAAGKAFLAAVTSPQVVKAEKAVAVLVITRVLIAVGASAGLIELVKQLGG